MSRRKTSGASGHQSELSLAVLKSFRIIYGSVRQHFRDVKDSCGVTGAQLWILHEVSQNKNIGVSELAGKLAIHQSTCSLHVERLVRDGLLIKQRTPEDQRRVKLLVTAKGRKVVASAPGPAEGVLPEAIAALSPASLRALQRGLNQLITELDIKDESAAERPLADL